MEEQHAFRGEILRALSQVYPVQSNGQIILAVVWICHMVYFLFGVRTIKKEDIEKQYPYVMQLQLEHVEHKKHQKN